LDQRTARADVRFSSISEFSDTPSVYSRAFFSPITPDKGEVDLPDDCRFKSFSPQSSACEALSNPDRLNDPAASMLDLDDDPRASFASSDAYGDEEQDLSHDDDDEPMPRMSLLGPKMRFHSRAPWEMDGDPLQEEDEWENSANHLQSASLARGRIKDDAVKKGLGLSPSSPRSSSATRPSRESSCSRGKSKTSLETATQTSNPRGALQ
jgi:hypothetical protein